MSIEKKTPALTPLQYFATSVPQALPPLHRCSCEGDGDVVDVVTPLLGGAQVVLHGVQVVELSVLLGVASGRRSGRGR